MSTQETVTTKAQIGNLKKAKAGKKAARTKKPTTPKKAAKGTKAKGVAKSGSKAAIRIYIGDYCSQRTIPLAGLMVEARWWRWRYW